jgi:hypothetical protein
MEKKMEKIKSIFVFSLCLAFCANFVACNGNGTPSAFLSESVNISSNDAPQEYTSFSQEEENRFLSSFGFVIPFIQNSSYRVEDYEGYNGDLMAYENGLVFIAEGLTEEACKDYVDNLKNDENYSFEYPQDGYYYFSREGYFVKIEYYWMKTCFGLTVYTYSYTFENVDSSSSEEDSSDSSSADIPDTPKFGFEYEKHSDSCSIIGFYGDEVGKCPLCGKEVIKGKYSYGCRGYKEGCTFRLNLSICKRVIPIHQARKLLAEGRTDLLHGFISPRTGNSFDARLRLEEGKAVFDFNK